MPNICVKQSFISMVLVLCVFLSGCKYSYDNPKTGNEVVPDKNTGAQPIVQSGDQGSSGMQPIAPTVNPQSTGSQPIAPHAVVDPHSNSVRTETSTVTTVTNPDGSTTTTTTVNGTTTTTTTTTVVVPSEDPASIAVTRPATTEEAKAHNCPGKATAIDQGLDSNRDGSLNTAEIMQTSVECQAGN